jgi:hypothetical protein
VGRQHLVPGAREEITSRRAVWGTDIYTDDSDIVAACIHAGWIRGEWPEDVDVDMLDLVVSDDSDKRGRRTAPTQPTSTSTNPDVLTEPPKTGPMAVPPNRDLHVTIVILPLLEKYSSTVRFGVKSREFGGKIVDSLGMPQRSLHDGLSFMITGIRWVSNGGGTQNRLRGKARRERIRRALREVEHAYLAAAKAMNIETKVTGDGPVEPSNTPLEGGVELSGSWWKTRGTPPSEGDKENVPAAAAEVVDNDDTVVVDEAQDKEDDGPSNEEENGGEPATKPVEEDSAPGTASELQAEEAPSGSAEAAEKVAEEVTKNIIESVVDQSEAEKGEAVGDVLKEAVAEKGDKALKQTVTEGTEEPTGAGDVRV